MLARWLAECSLTHAARQPPLPPLCTSEADGGVCKKTVWAVDFIILQRARHKVLSLEVSTQRAQQASHVPSPQRAAGGGGGGGRAATIPAPACIRAAGRKEA